MKMPHLQSDTAASPAAANRREWFDAIRFPVAVLLGMAAFLKMQQLRSPAVVDSWLGQFLLVHAEWALALWLISGVHRRLALGATLGTFSLFAVVSLVQAIGGADSCECFGEVQVNPWITLGIDLVVVGLLLVCRPAPGDTWSRAGRMPMVVGLVWLAGAAAGGYAMLTYAPGQLLSDGRIIGDARYIDVRPQQWLDQPLPLLDHIDIGPELRSSRWSIMFFNHRCPLCHAAIHQLIDDAAEYPEPDAVGRIVLVEVPPYGPEPAAEVRRLFRVGRLSDSRQWFIHIPTVIRIENSRVISAREGAVLQLSAREGETQDD